MRLKMVLIFLVVGYQSFAQLGINDLKRGLAKTKDKIIKKATDKGLNDLRSKIDTSSINLAVSFSDNAGKFEQNDRLSNLRTFADGFLLDDVSPDPIEKARESNEMGELFYSMNQFWLAQVWFQDAKLEFEQIGQTNHPQYFKVIANLGLLYHTMGRYAMAEEFTQMALEMRRDNLGSNSSATAASLNNMAVLNKDKGFYADAQRLFDQSIAIFSSNDPYGSSYAIVLNNKAILLQIMGQLGDAEKLLNQSLELAEDNTSLREKSNNYQRIMVNLALLYQEQGKYDKAEEIYLRAIKIKESQLKTKHPDYAHLLNNLASLYMIMGKYDQVEQNLLTALDIYEDKLGKVHPSYASTLSNLGNFYRYQGNTNLAKQKLQDALELRLEIFGEDHPSINQTKEDLALTYWIEGSIQLAADSYHEVLNKELDFIFSYFPPMTESEKAKFWAKSRVKFLRFYAFVGQHYQSIPGLTKAMYEYHIATKAILLNISTKIREEILNGSDENLKEKYLLWLDKKETLVTFYSYSKEELAKEKIDVARIENEANELERYLSSNSEIFREGYKNAQTTFEQVKSSLLADDAVVDIVQGYKFDKILSDQSQYYALITRSQDVEPVMKVLENGNELDGKYYKNYKNSIRLKMDDEYSFDNYWAKIEREVSTKKNLFVSFDGIFNQLNINTFRYPDKSYVIDRHRLVYLTNSKNIISYRKKSSERIASKNATLVGFPDYGNQGTISSLPGTKVEIDNIDLILKRNGFATEKYMVASASELNVKYSYDPSILHIATHGYFLNDQQASRSRQVFGVEPIRASENPLLRSGLFLAGAESAMTASMSMDSKSSNNGILTAYEAMNMHLNNTNIVILSACETGLGDVVAGEGVYGLQRAFQMAGTETVLMSLWKVDDNATKDLMVKFYEEWIKTNKKHEAFVNAQLALKAKYKNPYYWGAFVMIEH